MEARQWNPSSGKKVLSNQQVTCLAKMRSLGFDKQTIRLGFFLCNATMQSDFLWGGKRAREKDFFPKS